VALIVSISVNGVKIEYQLNLGDIVLTYDGRLDQVRGINFSTAEVRLSSGSWADPWELVPVRRVGWRAIETMKRRGRCAI
jgi:hypothetical protein